MLLTIIRAIGGAHSQLCLFGYAFIAHMSVAMSATMEAKETIDKTINADPVLILGFTGSFWDKALIVSLIIAAIAAVAVGFTTAASIIAHQQENIENEASLGRYKELASAKIAEARTEGINAGKAAGDAILRAGEANERAAKANERAALAELKTAEVGRELSAREFDKTNFLDKIKSVPKEPVRILSVPYDPDAFMLANFDIGLALNHAGWIVREDYKYIDHQTTTCIPYGGVVVARRMLSNEEVLDFEKIPDERKTIAWNIADSLHKSIKNSRGVGVISCHSLKDDALHILVGKHFPFVTKKMENLR